MIEYRVPYGEGELTFHLPQSVKPVIFRPKKEAGARDPVKLVENSLLFPRGGVNLEEVRGSKTVAVSVNDKTRPAINHILLPSLLDHLRKLGFRKNQVQFYIATGTHPPMSESEYRLILPPDVIDEYSINCHNCVNKQGAKFLGYTSRGTPVWINAGYANADLKIVVGIIEPHQFQGFSGGVKSAAIGLAAEETINHNHSMMNDPNARFGVYENNPARQDVEEIGRILGINFAINAVLNSEREIVEVLSGDPVQVMKEGLSRSQKINQVHVAKKYGLVIASPGGYPKDINLYQAQKALAHAGVVTKDGGVIILVAACNEGTGSKAYEKFIANKSSHQEVFDEFKKMGFTVGEHKAYQIAQIALRVQVILVSEMPDRLVQGCLLKSAGSIDEALIPALQNLRELDGIAIMPEAASMIPYLDR